MPLSPKAKKLHTELSSPSLKMGDLKKHGQLIKKDHPLALELWSTGDFHPRLLATLIFDKKLLTEEVIHTLTDDMQKHEAKERDNLADWFLANQLMKDSKLTTLLSTWQNNPSPILRRCFWYHQARLRWIGQTPPDNSEHLLTSLETDMAKAEPTVQWAMNFAACQIGLHETAFRPRCIKLGKAVGLYKDDHVSKNCTPSYLPEFISIEAAKREE